MLLKKLNKDNKVLFILEHQTIAAVFG